MTDRRILIVFQSSEGQTAKIAERVAMSLRGAGADVDVHPVWAAPPLSGYDAVVVGGSIHMSRHSKELTDYLASHAEALNAVPSAFFQVSLTSANSDPEHSVLARSMVRQLLEATGFKPDAVGLFAGALAYRRYGWAKRRLLRAVAQKMGLDADMTRDHEYTSWAEVEKFAHQVDALATGGTQSLPSGAAR